MPRLFALDALRGLAAVLVMISHIAQSAGANWYTGMAGLCVDFFLMLSGYVMARSYEGRLQTSLCAGAFLAKRFRRLWPVATLGLVLALLLTIWEETLGPETLGMAATALFFLPWISAVPGQTWLFPLNGPRWSLFAELAINWFHAAALARRTSWQLLSVVAICAIPVLAAGVALHDWPHAGHSDQFVPGMLRLLIAYVLGVVLYRWQRDRQVLRVSVSGLCLTLLASVYLGGLVHPALFGPLFLFGLCPLLVAGGAGLEVPAHARSWCAAAGAISFPLYALHSPLAELALFAGLPGGSVLVLALTLTGVGIAMLALRKSRQPDMAQTAA